MSSICPVFLIKVSTEIEKRTEMIIVFSSFSVKRSQESEKTGDWIIPDIMYMYYIF